MILDISQYRFRKLPNRTSEFAHRHIEVQHESEIDLSEGWSSVPAASFTGVGKLFSGKFEERNFLNVPGPFYGAMTDNCLTGPTEAPENVMVDTEGQEFVFRQPSSTDQIQQLIGAAFVDPFEGYGADGDSFWTLNLIREWWRGRSDLLAEESGLQKYNRNVAEWRQLVVGEYEPYLRQYAFFVEERRIPTSSDALPALLPSRR
jgi:hypothetical protein